MKWELLFPVPISLPPHGFVVLHGFDHPHGFVLHVSDHDSNEPRAKPG